MYAYENLKYNAKLMKFANKLANKNIENSWRTLLRCTKLAGSLKLSCVNRENFPVSTPFPSFSLSIFPLLSLSLPPLSRTTFNSSEFTGNHSTDVRYCSFDTLVNGISLKIRKLIQSTNWVSLNSLLLHSAFFYDILSNNGKLINIKLRWKL